jgi:hypothetical protein
LLIASFYRKLLSQAFIASFYTRLRFYRKLLTRVVIANAIPYYIIVGSPLLLITDRSLPFAIIEINFIDNRITFRIYSRGKSGGC